MTETKPTATFQIPEIKMEELKKVLDRLMKRAAKLDVESFSYGVGESKDVPYIGRNTLEGYRVSRFDGNAEQLKKAEDEGRITYRRYVTVTITGPNPVVAGWEFAATLEHLRDDNGDSMNMLRVSPQFEGKLPERFRTADPCCDHCHQIRARKDTYVVRHVETGDFKQVGSSCIKDFIGGNSPYAVASVFSFFLDALSECESFDEDDSLLGESFRGGAWSLREFLAATAAVVRTEGWLPKSKTDEFGPPATATLVVEHLMNKAKE